MVNSERKFTDEKVKQVIDFKRSVCKSGQSFAIINQKGIDPLSLDQLAKVFHYLFTYLNKIGGYLCSQKSETTQYGETNTSIWWCGCQLI